MVWALHFFNATHQICGFSKPPGIRMASRLCYAWQGAHAADKEAVLLALCARSFADGHVVVFFSTKKAAHRAKILFGLAGLPPAAELHGNMTQVCLVCSDSSSWLAAQRSNCYGDNM